jgi:hypothetical protein
MATSAQDHDSVKRFPLEWPLGWRRTPYSAKRHGQFRKERRPINVEQATRRLEDELDRLGATDPVLSTNVTLNLRGIPRGDTNPSDPGVAVYFRFKKKPTVLACDTFYTVAANIAAIAAHVEALRAIERYGVGTIEQALAGYKALPADSAADWRRVFFTAPFPPTYTVEAVNSAYKQLARVKHPDVTKDDGAAMAHLNRARDYAIAELEGR